MQKRASDLLGFRCSFLSFRCCAIYISITAWNCDFPRFLPDFEPFVLVSPDFWICGLYNDHANITVVISDNLTTAMTGGQDSAGTNKFEAICLGLGVEPEHVRVVVPLPKNMEEITRIIREEIEYKGVSVIIPRRECIQTLNRKLRQKKADKA